MCIRDSPCDAVKECLSELMKTAGIDVNVCFQEWLKLLLPIAERHHSNGAPWRTAWAIASADFPELKIGRSVVELLAGAVHQTSNVERTFGSISLHEQKQRAALQGRTLEMLLLARQSAPVGNWRAWGAMQRGWLSSPHDLKEFAP